MGAVIDTITLTGVRARGFHGVLSKERAQGQDFFIDVTLYVSELPTNDELDSTVDYSTVADIIVKTTGSGPFQLIETLAHELAMNILAFAHTAESISVTVHKPDAPIGHPFEDVAVTITRSRNV